MKELSLREVMEMYSGGKEVSQIGNPVIDMLTLGLNKDLEFLEYKVRPKECFKNCVFMCRFLESRGFKCRYCEGFVTYDKKFPIEHAFIMVKIRDAEWGILDPTFEIALKQGLSELRKEDYYLIKDFSSEELTEIMLKEKRYGPFYNLKR